jgi:phosphatidylglycerophosphatase A
MKWFSKAFATLFGIGFFPRAPGTASSVAALAVYALALHKLAWPVYLLLLAGLFFL